MRISNIDIQSKCPAVCCYYWENNTDVLNVQLRFETLGGTFDTSSSSSCEPVLIPDGEPRDGYTNSEQQNEYSYDDPFNKKLSDLFIIIDYYTKMFNIMA